MCPGRTLHNNNILAGFYVCIVEAMNGVIYRPILPSPTICSVQGQVLMHMRIMLRLSGFVLTMAEFDWPNRGE